MPNARPWPRASLLVTATLASLPHSLYAADSPRQDVESIQVVGSRISIRSAEDSAVPVDILRAEDLQRAGFADMGMALEAIAPSFNFAETTISDGSDHVKPATLRGLNPDQVLVLINGKRRHASALIHIFTVGKGSAGTDLNAIPMSAVSRVEILRDGASAQYGSDAIAGVINIVLKNSTGTTLEQEVSRTHEGDGDTYQTSLNSGFALGGSGVINLTGEFKHKNDTNRAAPDPAGGQYRMGEPNLEQTSLFYNAELAVGEAEFYSFGGHSNRDAEAAGFYRYVEDLPEAQRPRYPGGFLPRINSKVIDNSLAAGLRFPLAGWQGDLSLVRGENSFEFGVSNSLNKSYNAGPSGDYRQIPTRAKSGTLNFEQTTANLDFSRDVELAGRTLNLAVGVEHRKDGYSIEAGDEYSWAYYGNEPWGSSDSPPGIQVFPGWSPAQEIAIERKNNAVFIEAATELTDNWRVEGALRHEDYSDFGTDLSSKLATYLEINEQVKLRGSVSDGFRAPAVQQYGYTQFISNFENQQNVTEGIFPHGSTVVNALEIPGLKAEESISYTLGLVLTPTDDLNITLDLYRIDIDDRISISGEFERSAHPLLDSLLPRDVSAASFFTNAINTRTEGADLVLNFTDDRGDAKMRYNAAFGYNNTQVLSVNTPPGRLAQLGLDDVYFDFKERARVERYQPDTRATVGGIYDAGRWDLGLTFNYYGEIFTANDVSDRRYDFTESAGIIADLSGRYDFNNGLVLRGGINNVADKYPDGDPKAFTDDSYNGPALPWSIENSQWGLAGRIYYVKGSYTF